VKALTYFPSIPRYFAARASGRRYPQAMLPLRLEEVAPPEPRADWVRVRVRACGICGSDLALLYGMSSPRLSPFFSFPAVLGHEILGELDGSRVAVDPLLACRERELAPCGACSRGDDHLCANVAEGALQPGMIGFCASLPGGWTEETIARRERLHEIPPGVPDDRAVLAEPLAVAVHGLSLLCTPPRTVLVIGAGTIGLCAVAALRALGHDGPLHVLARHPRQAELAELLGADGVHGQLDAAREAGGGRAYPAIIGPAGHRGGFDLVVDAAGSGSSMGAAAWLAREGGTLLLLGAPGRQIHDFAPHWFRELTLAGSYTYRPSDFGRAVTLLPDLEGLESLVGPRHALSDWRSALRSAISPASPKTIFQN
jgi:threonine dehydrogenase-like Zn-dependent dehydrogenase